MANVWTVLQSIMTAPRRIDIATGDQGVSGATRRLLSRFSILESFLGLSINESQRVSHFLA